MARAADHLVMARIFSARCSNVWASEPYWVALYKTTRFLRLMDYLGVVRVEGYSQDCQRLFQKWLDCGVLALIPVAAGQIVEVHSSIGVVGVAIVFGDLQSRLCDDPPPCHTLRPDIVSPLLVEEAPFNVSSTPVSLLAPWVWLAP